MAKKMKYSLSKKAMEDAHEMLEDLAKDMPDAGESLVDDLAAIAAERAEEVCPSSRIKFSTVHYKTDGPTVARVVASGPVLKRHRPGSVSSTASYSIPLAKVLEYGTGHRADKAYAAEHGYRVNVSGKKGWNVPKEADDNSGYSGSGELVLVGNSLKREGHDTEFRFTDGTVPYYFMRSAAREAQAEVEIRWLENLSKVL